MSRNFSIENVVELLNGLLDVAKAHQMIVPVRSVYIAYLENLSFAEALLCAHGFNKLLDYHVEHEHYSHHRNAGTNVVE